MATEGTSMTDTTQRLQAVHRETIEEKVYHSLRREILEGRLRGGQRLVQEELAEMLGTSRIPVRGALKSLAGSGLVTVDAKGYYSVATFGEADIAEIYELRALLEPYAAVKAAENIGAAEMKHLRGLNQAMETSFAAGDTDRWTEQNAEFHMAIYGACRQSRLLGMIRDTWHGRPSFSPIKTKQHLRKSLDEHVAILDAIESKDASLIERRVRDHILAAEHIWREYLHTRDNRDAATS